MIVIICNLSNIKSEVWTFYLCKIFSSFHIPWTRWIVKALRSICVLLWCYNRVLINVNSYSNGNIISIPIEKLCVPFPGRSEVRLSQWGVPGAGRDSAVKSDSAAWETICLLFKQVISFKSSLFWEQSKPNRDEPFGIILFYFFLG